MSLRHSGWTDSLLCFFILGLEVYILKKFEQKDSGVGCY